MIYHCIINSNKLIMIDSIIDDLEKILFYSLSWTKFLNNKLLAMKSHSSSKKIPVIITNFVPLYNSLFGGTILNGARINMTLPAASPVPSSSPSAAVISSAVKKVIPFLSNTGRTRTRAKR